MYNLKDSSFNNIYTYYIWCYLVFCFQFHFIPLCFLLNNADCDPPNSLKNPAIRKNVIIMYTCKDNLTPLLYSGKIKKKKFQTAGLYLYKPCNILIHEPQFSFSIFSLPSFYYVVYLSNHPLVSSSPQCYFLPSELSQLSQLVKSNCSLTPHLYLSRETWQEKSHKQAKSSTNEALNAT